MYSLTAGIFDNDDVEFTLVLIEGKFDAELSLVIVL